MLLLQEDPNRGWTAAAINMRLRSQESSIAKWLSALSACGLASVAEGRYRFAPKSPDLDRSAWALAEAYRERRVQVIEFIFSKSNESVLSFVRAFDLDHQGQL